MVTGDQSAAIFDRGEPDDAVRINLGTGAFLFQRVSSLASVPETLLLSVVCERAGERTLVLEGAVNGAGATLQAEAVRSPSRLPANFHKEWRTYRFVVKR